MIEYRTGDIFAMPDLQALGHGVNCKGKMGSGIAVLFRNKFKEMHKDYVKLCDEDKLQLGEVFPYYDETENITIFNMASQYFPGADARLDALLTSVREVEQYCRHHGIDVVGLPQIGCGIGGLDWEVVRRAIEDEVGESPVKFVLVTFG